ncbi:MAG: DNA methyltransferase [Agriterribacter sp.]
MELIEKYNELLTRKIKVAHKRGFQIDRNLLHWSNKPHQNDIIERCIADGAQLVAADTGLGKTAMAIQICQLIIANNPFQIGKALIVTELGAAETFVNPDPEVGEGARLGIQLSYVTNQEEALSSTCDIVVTNYERVRMGAFDFSAFDVVCLDEGNYIKNMASETTDMLAKQLAKVKYKFIFTATPSPNETLELINYAHVLGIADRGGILTRFFQRDSTKAGELTVHPQHEDDFWLWVYSWAIFIQYPSDLGYDDEGYKLPPLNVYWHEVKLDVPIEPKPEKNGQGRLYAESNGSATESFALKRHSINARLKAAIDKMKECDPDGTAHWIIWHHLEDERKAINKAFKDHPSYADVYGTLNWKEKEKRTVDFIKGKLQIFSTKSDINGVGSNFQGHCFNNVVLGVNDSFDALYQLIKRTHRYPQKFPVNVHIFYLPEEYKTVQNLQRKWKEHDVTRAKMRDLYLKYGLDYRGNIETRKRSFMQERIEWKGEHFTLVNNDSVLEYAGEADNSVDLINTSIPFGNHYEYSDKYNDFGHNEDNAHFFRQMDFLVPQLFRVLKPGRIAAIHTKNRIHYGSVTGLGFSIFHRFTHAACDCFEKHGFQTMGFHYIPTDVVAENNQTYRLTYGEMQKDSTKMGSGIPEEIWLFRKPPTSRENAYADQPVTHNMASCPACGFTDVVSEFLRDGAMLMDCPKCKQFFQPSEFRYHGNQNYSLAKWQIDADSFWKSSGDRLLQPDELMGMSMKQVRKWWNRFNSATIYDFEQHVKLLQYLDDKGRLSRTYTTLPLRSNTPYIWNDVNRMQGLNLEQARRKQQNHICPQPFDQVDRIIDLYSNEGERVDDCFGGLGTTGVRAIKKKRKTKICELNNLYARNAFFYLRQAEENINTPTLFDLIEMES